MSKNKRYRKLEAGEEITERCNKIGTQMSFVECRCCAL